MTNTSVLETDLNKFDKKLNTYPFEPRLYINRGMMYFRMGRLSDSLKDFNKAEELNPQLTPYLWQRGLTYYYLQKYAKAARQFELNLSIQSQDTQKTLWFFLCIAHLEDITSARDSLLSIKNNIPGYMKNIYLAFAGKYSMDTLTNLNGNHDVYHLFYANFYAGLYYEVQQEQEQSNNLIEEAIKHKINDYMWDVACIQKSLRGC